MEKSPEEVYAEKLDKIIKAAVKPDFDIVTGRFDHVDSELKAIKSTLAELKTIKSTLDAIGNKLK